MIIKECEHLGSVLGKLDEGHFQQNYEGIFLNDGKKKNMVLSEFVAHLRQQNK